jgi:myo-inositol-1(or 4)-monophosphatase
VTPEEILDLFTATAQAVRDAVYAIELIAIRDRTEKPGQYALDLVADAAALAVLGAAPVRIVSEESGVHERAGASITVVVDPIDGSTNCARGVAYWGTSLCALDADGALVGMVVNHPAAATASAVRGRGADRNGVPLRVSNVTRLQDSVVAGWFPKPVPAKQARVLGSIALELVDVAAGGLDGHIDGTRITAPWDYLGGMLIVQEAGGVVRDIDGDEIVTDDPDARRQIVAAGTEELADALEQAMLA